MKVSCSWLNEFVQTNKSPEEIAEILTSIGLEVEGIEAHETVRGGLRGCVVGQIVEHEKLDFEGKTISLNKVDVGSGRVLQVICGAPNAAFGLKICMALPGTDLFPAGSDKAFSIGERKTYGHLSQGMVCAEDELGLGTSHAGIKILPDDAPIGQPLAEYFEIETDTMIEIGLTPNRADATSILGVARDLAAALRTREKGLFELKMPEIDEKRLEKTADEKLEIIIENAASCPRYAGVVLKDLTVGESPKWLRNRLEAYGERSINNVVDATNLVRLELGQPLHAFDLSEIGERTIRVKNLAEGTPFLALDGSEKKLFADDLMICDGDSRPMCIGGVFGGQTSGVKNSTTAIFLESAHFSAKTIRKTMTRHGLRTEAAKIFEKTSDPNVVLFAAKRAAALILELAGGAVASPFFDIAAEKFEAKKVECTWRGIDRLTGFPFENAEVKRILKNLEIEIEDENRLGFTAVVPTSKPEVLRECDVAEEVLRMIGTDAVPLTGRISAAIEVSPKPDPFKIRELASELLVGAGLTEIMALSLSNSAFYGEIDPETLVFVNNTANQGLDVLRPTMLFGGLDAIERNQNRQQPDVRFFEFGKTYSKNPTPALPRGEGDAAAGATYLEKNMLAIFLTGAHSNESWETAKKADADFFTLKSLVQNLFARLGVAGFQESVEGAETPFRYALRLHRGPQVLARIGQIQPSISKKMGVKQPVFYAEIEWDAAMKALGASKIQFRELGRFPTVRRDLALVIDEKIAFSEVKTLASKTAKKLLREINLFDVFADESKLGAGKKSYAVSFVFEDLEKTLAEKEIEAAMADLQVAFESKLGAVIRK